MSGFFYNLGRHLGRKAIPAARKGKWIWEGLTGDGPEAARARRALGAEMAAEMRRLYAPARETDSTELVNTICERLAGRLRNQAFSFHCEVLQDKSATAVALPGGYLFISEALVGFCASDPDELAFVIGHEMAHVVRGHAWDRMVNEAALRFASALSLRSGQLGGWFRSKGLALLRSAYSGQAELEADEFGYRLAVAAGFSPAGAVEFLHRIGREQAKGSNCGPYFASHPPPAQRLRRVGGPAGE